MLTTFDSTAASLVKSRPQPGDIVFSADGARVVDSVSPDTVTVHHTRGRRDRTSIRRADWKGIVSDSDHVITHDLLSNDHNAQVHQVASLHSRIGLI